MCHRLSKTSATLMSRQWTYELQRTQDQMGRCPASEQVISSPKAIKQKLLSKLSMDTSFWPKLMCHRLVLFCNLLHAKEAWRTETFCIILINSIPLHIPRPSTRLGHPTVRISSYRYFIHHRLIRNSSAIRHFILRRTTCSSSAPSLNQALGVLQRHGPKRTLASDGTLTMRKCLCSYGERT